MPPDDRPVRTAERCANHPTRTTVASCDVCGRPLCVECAVPVRGRVLGTECLSEVLGDETPVAAPRPWRRRVVRAPTDRVAGAMLAIVVGATMLPWTRFSTGSGFAGAWGFDARWSMDVAVVAMVALALWFALGRRPEASRIVAMVGGQETEVATAPSAAKPAKFPRVSIKPVDGAPGDGRDSLRLARAPTIAIGIDPAPQLTAPLASNQKVFAETSDAFFAAHDVRAELGGQPIDLAFIDGMHHFEFALRDFANIERHCTPRSTILIHDCYPLDRVTAERERRRNFWSGDVWRLVALLKKVRPDLSLHTIAAAPTGLVVVRNLDPGSRLLLERHDALVREFLALDYSWLEDDMAGKLSLFPNDWTKVRALLR